MRILVVDDDSIQRKLLRVILGSAGHQVIEAQDGVEGLEVLCSGGFDAVFTDVLMPRMDGYRLCYEIRKRRPLRSLPILMYTSSYTSPSDESLGRRAGADEFLRKPESAAGILEALDRVVRTPRPEESPPGAVGELEILKLYSEALVRKLERKNLDLQVAHEQLTEAHEGLRHSEEKVSTLLDSTTEGIYGLDMECRLTFSNAACAHLLGYADPADLLGMDSAEILGRKAHAWIHDSMKEGVPVLRDVCGICRTIVDGQPHSSTYDVFWRPDGTSFAAEYRSYPVRHEGRQIGAVVTFSDITERRRIEDALRQSEKRFSLAFHANPVATSIAEIATSRILDVNDEFLRVLGYDRGEVVGKTSAELGVWEDPGERARIVEEVFREGGIRDRKGKLRTKTRETRDVLGSVVRIDLGAVPCVLSTFTDVTAREAAEKDLRDSLQRNRALMENAKDAITVIALDGTVLEVNRAAEELFGRSRETIQGRSMSELVPPEEQEPVGQSFAEAVGRGGVVGLATRILRSDGSRRPVEISASVVEVGGAKVMHSILRDVSERERAQEELRSSEQRYRLLFDGNPQPLWVFDDETFAFLAVNDAACSRYGYSREEFLGMTILDIRPADEVPRLVRSVHETSRAYSDSGVWRHRRKDGSVIDVAITSHPLIFDGRKCQLVLALDVTDRLRAEEALRKSEERYHLLFDHNLAGVVRTTLAGRVLDCNDAMVQIYGYGSREEVMACGAEELYPRPGDRAALMERLVRDGTVLNLEQEGRRKDGSAVWLLCNYTIKEGPEESLIHCTLLDVTDRRRLEDELRQSQKMEAVGQLAGGIAHDFNNILTTITGYSSLALERIDPKDPLFEDIFEIQRGAERAAELTRNLLAFSRKQFLDPRVIDLNATVAGVERMLRRVFGADVELVVRPAGDLGNVRADPGQIEQVLLNLAVNSRDAMPKGGSLTIATSNVRLDAAAARASPGLPESGEFVMLAVSDTGLGIDVATQAHIFDPFFTTKEAGKGTGLGLSTVYGIVKQSGGHIVCDSEVGVGTTFRIYLPLIRERAEAVIARPASRDPRGSETILLVEDEEALGKLARRALEKQGYRVIEARSGIEARQIASVTPSIDLLLTDIVMPGISGRELADELLASRPGLRVLFMSGYTDDAAVRQGILVPGMAFLQKPFTPSKLAHKVRETLAVRAAGVKAGS
ncbi:MAG: PAS domain S-box protein [Acidobacteriota bacterium]